MNMSVRWSWQPVAAVLLDEAVLGPELVDQGRLVGGLCEPGREADKRGRDHGFDGVLH
jgi:hypothetical protein